MERLRETKGGNEGCSGRRRKLKKRHDQRHFKRLYFSVVYLNAFCSDKVCSFECKEDKGMMKWK
jgi:hypothetical protein